MKAQPLVKHPSSGLTLCIAHFWEPLFGFGHLMRHCRLEKFGRVSVCCSGDPSADGLAELTMGVAARHSSPLQQTDSIRIAWLDAREYIKREDCMKARVLLLSAFAALLVAAANYADEHTKPASKGESVLRVETRLVQVNVVAQDSKGNAITGLTRDDFTLFD